MYLTDTSDVSLLRLSNYIGNEWGKLGFLLGLSEAKLQNIGEDHKNNEINSITEMLVTWRDGYDGNTTETLDCLSNTLERIGIKCTLTQVSLC